jgi:hypothetical protein
MDDTCTVPCKKETIEWYIFKNWWQLEKLSDDCTDPVKGCKVTCKVSAGFKKGDAEVKCPEEGGPPIITTDCKPVPCNKDTVKAYIEKKHSLEALKDDEPCNDPVKGCKVTCKDGFIPRDTVLKCPKEGGLPIITPECRRRPNCPDIVSPRYPHRRRGKLCAEGSTGDKKMYPKTRALRKTRRYML